MNGKDLRYRWQNWKKTGVYLAILIFLVALGTTALSTTSPSTTVYVAADGRGNFNCDGSDDQVEINKALTYVAENPQFTTIHLKGSQYIRHFGQYFNWKRHSSGRRFHSRN